MDIQPVKIASRPLFTGMRNSSSGPNPPAGLPQSNARPSGLFETIKRGETFRPAVHESVAREQALVEVDRLSLWYGKTQAIHDVSLTCPAGIGMFTSNSACEAPYQRLKRSISRTAFSSLTAGWV